jgi:hypothetical protein
VIYSKTPKNNITSVFRMSTKKCGLALDAPVAGRRLQLDPSVVPSNWSHPRTINGVGILFASCLQKADSPPKVGRELRAKRVHPLFLQMICTDRIIGPKKKPPNPEIGGLLVREIGTHYFISTIFLDWTKSPACNR